MPIGLQPPDKPLRHIFLDWHGTLSMSLFWQQWSADGHPRRADFGRIQALWPIELRSPLLLWMRSELVSEEFVAGVAGLLGCCYEELFAEFVQSCETMRLASDELPGLIHRIRESGIRVVLATDNMDCFTRWTVPALCLRTLFDDILCSHELGCLKEELDANGLSRFFGPYLERHQVRPGESILFDDSETIREVMRTCGIGYCRVTTEAPLHALLQRVEATKHTAIS